MARPPDLDDHISWLISVERYEEALESARSHERELKSHKVNELGQKYLHVRLIRSAHPNLPLTFVFLINTKTSIYWRMIWLSKPVLSVARFYKAISNFGRIGSLSLANVVT
jgi:hypothetical protein